MDVIHGQTWTLYNGDCCQVLQEMPESSVDMVIHSPPFSSLYIYSDSENDMGNCSGDEEFFQHYSYCIKELLRVTVPGRICAVHCKDLPKYANVWGTTGLIDFPGACIQEFEDAGWVYHSRVTIWKCPVIERERTNNNGLLHKTVKRDTSQVRQGMADYLLIFRKPPSDGLMSEKPVVRERGFERYIGKLDPRGINTPADDEHHGTEHSDKNHPSKYSRSPSSNPHLAIWQRYAEPVWWDISQTNVLNFKLATSEQDEKHICPLQLDLIERAIDIWTNHGDVVLSPFAGIGSEGVGALRAGRKFVGVELKKSYFDAACKFLDSEEKEQAIPTLFDEATA